MWVNRITVSYIVYMQSTVSCRVGISKNTVSHLVAQKFPDMLGHVRADGGENNGLPLYILEDQLAAHGCLPAEQLVLVPGRLQLEETGSQRLLEEQLLVGLVGLDQLAVHLHQEHLVVEGGGASAPK